MKSLPIALGLCAVFAVPAQAQVVDADPSAADSDTVILIAEEAPDDMYAVVVTGMRDHVDNLSVPLSVIGLEEIRSVQGSDIARILQRAPGVTISRNGGMGSLTSVRLRGAEADQVLVLLDEVPLNDVASPGGGYDFSAVLPAGISKVEVQRNSNSTVWGSRAMGGVIAMASARQDDLSAEAEYGGPQTVFLQANGTQYSQDIEASANFALVDSAGFSAAAQGTEPDGLRQWQAGGALRFSPGNNWSMRGNYRHSDARVEFDGFPAPDYTLTDTDEWQHSVLDAGSLSLGYYDRPLNLRATYSRSRTARETFDRTAGSAPNYSGTGTSDRIALHGDLDLDDRVFSINSLQVGMEQEWSRNANLFAETQATASRAIYGQLTYRLDGVRAHAGIRRDQHRDFGGQWSLGGDAAVELFDDWEAQASYGEGFKAPSLFQLHSDYGNIALRPERSRSFDVSLQRGAQNFRGFYRITAFRRDSVDLIGFVSCFDETQGICFDRPYGTYDNVGQARSQGVEVEAEHPIAEGLFGRIAYAYTTSTNRDSGLRLARRPRHAGTFTLDWQALDSLTLGADLRVVSASFDDPGNIVRLGGYAVVDLRASWDIGEHFALFGRVENAGDEHYQTAAGYATQGRAAFVGVRARL